MKTLRPIYDFDKYSTPIAKAIYAMLYKSIFAPIFDILKPGSEVENAGANALIQAIKSGRIQYVDGYFIGPLNIRISKELRGLGAIYNKTRKAYALEMSHLPQDIIAVISGAAFETSEKFKKVEQFLTAIEGRKLESPQLELFLDDTLAGLSKQFQSTTKSISSRDIEIPLRPELAEKMKEAYTLNLEKYINDWHDEEILRLRKKVERNVQSGFRAESLISDIQYEKGVSFNKAKFLAKQETSLMVSKYREARYEEIGIRKYMWSTSRDSRVRHDHRELQGKIFDFDHPPVTDRHTMARNNPGEDYGCRCVAIPVLSTVNMLHREYATQ